MFHRSASLAYLGNGAPIRFVPIDTGDRCVTLYETVGVEEGRDESAVLRVPYRYFLRDNFNLEDYITRQFAYGFGLNVEERGRTVRVYPSNTALGSLVPEAVAYALNWALTFFPAERQPEEGCVRFYAFRPFARALHIVVCDTILGASWTLRLRDIDQGINVWSWYLYQRNRFVGSGLRRTTYPRNYQTRWFQTPTQVALRRAFDVFEHDDGAFPFRWFREPVVDLVTEGTFPDAWFVMERSVRLNGREPLRDCTGAVLNVFAVTKGGPGFNDHGRERLSLEM
ncbi:hypothetical protein HDZ31DRAFT_77795 [Schizophyllum fasciatum]